MWLIPRRSEEFSIKAEISQMRKQSHAFIMFIFQIYAGFSLPYI